MGIKSSQLWAYFKRKPFLLMNKYERWKKVAHLKKLSSNALRRLEWIIFYETKAESNASFTCRHFGIAPKTFYKYLNRFDSNDLSSLEEHSRSPHNVRKRTITLLEEQRVISLRKKYLFYGKEKLRAEYNHLYHEDISNWKIYYTIRKHNLYPNPKQTSKLRIKLLKGRKKKRITDLKTRNQSILGHLIQVDTIVLHLFGLKRYILTAIDKYGKLAFARVYKNPSSFSASDFLRRLNYLLDDQITNIQTDNGSEFGKYFERACQELKVNHYFSRTRTPKDNAVLERFNRTLQEEWLNQGNFYPSISTMNQHLTDWLIFYNFKRRHHTLGNLSPIDYCIKHRQLLPMYSTRTVCLVVRLLDISILDCLFEDRLYQHNQYDYSYRGTWAISDCFLAKAPMEEL